jgi:hypothetical protein
MGGNLHQREARSSSPFRRRPYIDNGREPGGPNETSFNAAKAAPARNPRARTRGGRRHGGDVEAEPRHPPLN